MQEERQSYQLTYRENKILNFTYKSTVIKAEPLPTVAVDDSTLVLAVSETIEDAVLGGVQGFQIHMWCLQCESKFLKLTIVQCQKCDLMQLTDFCTYQITSKLLFTKTIESKPQYYLLNCKYL